MRRRDVPKRKRIVLVLSLMCCVGECFFVEPRSTTTRRRIVASVLSLEEQMAAIRGTMTRRISVFGLSESEEAAVLETCERVTGLFYAVERSSPLVTGSNYVAVEGEEPGSEALLAISDLLDEERDDVLVVGDGSPEEAARKHASFYKLLEAAPVKSTRWTIKEVKKVAAATIDGEFRNNRFDASQIVVIDGLVDEKLRSSMMTLLGGDLPRPNETIWQRGSLRDVLDDDGVKTNKKKRSWGLKPKDLKSLASADPIVEFQSRIRLFLDDVNKNSSFTLSLLPTAALGDDISPITVNAPFYGEDFQFHIDADPFVFPPSPWRDFFGKYVNRDPKKPRLVSALCYLSDNWDSSWGAPTRFRDPPTQSHIDVLPKPGRVVLLDQDIGHSVIAPTIKANKPRYSIVLKLVLHSGHHPLSSLKSTKKKKKKKKQNNDHHHWEETATTVAIVPDDTIPVLVGSADPERKTDLATHITIT